MSSSDENIYEDTKDKYCNILTWFGYLSIEILEGHKLLKNELLLKIDNPNHDLKKIGPKFRKYLTYCKKLKEINEKITKINNLSIEMIESLEDCSGLFE